MTFDWDYSRNRLAPSHPFHRLFPGESGRRLSNSTVRSLNAYSGAVAFTVSDLSLDRSVSIACTTFAGLWHFAHRLDRGRKTRNRYLTCPLIPILNDHRYWIPDETTFDALAYQWENILWLSDDVVNALPEGAPFPGC